LSYCPASSSTFEPLRQNESKGWHLSFKNEEPRPVWPSSEVLCVYAEQRALALTDRMQFDQLKRHFSCQFSNRETSGVATLGGFLLTRLLLTMSAFGTKRTNQPPTHLSAIGLRADIDPHWRASHLRPDLARNI
jgi:hypothetical protein